MASYTYAQNAELGVILQNKIPERTFDDAVFTDIMPVDSVNAGRIIWDIRDDYRGLTAGRTYDGPFGQVKREGLNTFGIDPAPYGEEKVMSEDWLLNTRQAGKFGDAIDLSEAQMLDQDHLIDRAINRLRWVGWTLVTTGAYNIIGPQGQLIQKDQYTLNSYTAATSWSNFAASTPLYDLRQMKLKHRGQSASCGAKAKLYLQSQDVNNLLSNTNLNDLGAKRVITVNAGAQPMTLADVNRYMLEADLPQIVEYDKWYRDDSGAVHQFIPQGTGVLVGARDMGDPVAEFKMTPNFGHLAGGGKSVEDGPWSNIFFDFNLDMKRQQGVSRIAFNGAPAVYYPTAIVVLTC